MKNKNKLYELMLNIRNILRITKKNNFIVAGIDPGSKIGIAVFTIRNANSDSSELKHIFSEQKCFTKELNITGSDNRIYKINNFINEILTKYRVDIVILEKAYYSSGRYSYSENLLARYTGSIYLTVKNLRIFVISISYKSMQKIILEKSTYKQDKEAIMEEILKIYPHKIIKTHHDKLDAIGYVYAFYIALKLYYHII